MVQEEPRNDGSDEQMLGTENDNLTAKHDEVKFTKGDHQNGDAKIDIGNVNGKSFTGMSKEELMKYANDPFWVRLRWIFFVSFWLIWVGMLVAAIFIILDAPKCAAPKPLSWFNSGPLVNVQSLEVNPADVKQAEKLQASAVIYELPADETYNLKENTELNEKIKRVVAQYNDTDINVVLDITPNFVTKESQLFKDALADEAKRAAFIWLEKQEVPNNWLSIVNGSAWSEVQPGQFVLSQFGDGRYDLHMAEPMVKSAFIDVLNHLQSLGVKGFRLKNSKFFLISKNIDMDEVPSNDPNYMHTQYGFWTHAQTTFQEGLGDLLSEFRATVKANNEAGYLSIAEDVVRPEVYRTSTGNYFSIDTPQYGRFIHVLSGYQSNGKVLRRELVNVFAESGNDTWLQWNLANLNDDSAIEPSAYVLFLSLLPGMQVVPIKSPVAQNVSADVYRHVHHLRVSPSFMHGEFALHDHDELIAYSRQRIKAGNPGYFVAFNPTNKLQTADFSNPQLPERMTVDAISAKYNVTGISVRSKMPINNLEVAPYSTIILTFVPVKSD